MTITDPRNVASRFLAADFGRISWLINRFLSSGRGEIFSRALVFGRQLALIRGIAPSPHVAEHPTSDALTVALPDAVFPPEIHHEQKERIDRASDECLAHRASFFGLRGADLGECIDWHRDYSSGLVGPLRYSPFIDYRNALRVGDVKYIWELNRLQHLVLLALAFTWTRKDAFIAEIREQTSSWRRQNPFMRGLNWRSPLEAGIRLISWALVSFLLESSGKLINAELTATIYQHQYFISQFYSKHSSANNHLIGEMAGLYIASVIWPIYRESARWRSLARTKLIEECLRQIETDGVGREHATEYQLFVLEFLLLSASLGQAVGEPFPSEYWERLQRMAVFVSAVSDRSGHLPRFGDGDSGVVVPLREGINRRARSLVRLLLPDTRSEKHAATDARMWLLLWGQPADQMPLTSLTRGSAVLQAFPDGGYYVLAANRAEANELIVVFDAAPLGFAPLYAHGHADALNFWLSYGGREFLIDPGTFCYYTADKWRTYFRGTAAHNTVRIDHEDQSVMAGRFLWQHVAHCRTEHVDVQSDGGAVRASHDGYRRLSDPAIHTREMRLDRNNLRLLITDSIECNAGHDIEIFFHFSEHCKVSSDTEQVLVAENGGRRLAVRVDPAFQMQLYHGSENPALGWVSRRFGVKQPSYTWVGRARIDRSTRIRCEIFPADR